MSHKLIMVLGFILLFVLASSLLFYWFRNDTTTIYTYSYGRQTTFELAEVEEVFDVDVSTSTPDDEHVSFKVPDKDAFLENHVLDHEHYVISYELYTESGEYHRTFYLFEYKRQLFSLYYNENLEQFRMEHVGADLRDIHLYVPFPTRDYYSDSIMNFSDPVLWSDVSWTPWESFEDAADFYETLSDDQADIDYDQKTIDLNGLINRYNEVEGFTEDYPVTFRFTEDGFFIEHENLSE